MACPAVVEEEGSLGSLDGIYPWQCVDTRVWVLLTRTVSKPAVLRGELMT